MFLFVQYAVFVVVTKTIKMTVIEYVIRSHTTHVTCISHKWNKAERSLCCTSAVTGESQASQIIINVGETLTHLNSLIHAATPHT